MIGSNNKLIDIALLTRFKQNCDGIYAAKGDVSTLQSLVGDIQASVGEVQSDVDSIQSSIADVNDSVESTSAAVETNANDILVLHNTLMALVERGLGEIDGYQVILKEESEYEQLTANNTIPGILYFGLEPLGAEDGTLEISDGYALMNATISNGYAEISASFDNGYATI